MGRIRSKKVKYKGIEFKSELEKDFYAKALKAKIPVEYEKQSYTILDGFKLEVGETYIPWGKGFSKRNASTAKVSYTPDFEYDNGKTFYYIETKGRQNEKYPFYRKLFLRYLERRAIPYVFFQPRTKKHNTEVVEIMKSLIKTK